MRRAALFAVSVIALVLAATSGAWEARDGDTFRVALDATYITAIDPALLSRPGTFQLLRPACGTLMGYPDKRLPEGLVLAPDLAEKEPVISKDGKTYTFVIREDAHFSTGRR